MRNVRTAHVVPTLETDICIFGQDTDIAIFVLAPLLLLLSQDSVLHQLTPQRRYLPVTASISIYLLLSSVGQVEDLATAACLVETLGHMGITHNIQTVRHSSLA